MISFFLSVLIGADSYPDYTVKSLSPMHDIRTDLDKHATERAPVDITLQDRTKCKKSMLTLRQDQILPDNQKKNEDLSLESGGVIPVFIHPNGGLFFLKSDWAEKRPKIWSICYGGNKIIDDYRDRDATVGSTQQTYFLEGLAGFFDDSELKEKNTLLHRNVTEVVNQLENWEDDALDTNFVQAAFWYPNRKDSFTRLGVIFLPLEVLGQNASLLIEQRQLAENYYTGQGCNFCYTSRDNYTLINVKDFYQIAPKKWDQSVHPAFQTFDKVVYNYCIDWNLWRIIQCMVPDDNFPPESFMDKETYEKFLSRSNMRK